MRLENSFDVPAPPDRVWALLEDVPRVIPCMPGAELTEVPGENAWNVTMHVKLGPIALQFDVDISRERVDESAATIVLAAKAREVKGRGGARATIASSLTPISNGTKCSIVTDLDLQGAVAQYSRGIVPTVAAELTQRFAECLAKTAQDNVGSEDAPPPMPAKVKPIGGLSLGVAAFAHWIRRLFQRT